MRMKSNYMTINFYIDFSSLIKLVSAIFENIVNMGEIDDIVFLSWYLL